MKTLKPLREYTHTRTHTQGNLINKEDKANNISLYINVYITDRLLM